ncbi:MAG: histidine kinase [Prolixibacteraceae bacterium]|nr:histidine kinase [Prolixibacteraceae bacterium]
MKQLKRFPNVLVKYISMFVVLNLMHYLFKFYDRSFESILEYNERGILFHLFFVVYGLIIWVTGIALTQSTYKKLGKHFRQNLRFVVLGLMLVIYGIAFSTLYGEVYYRLFFVCFNLESAWPDYHLLDRDFTIMMFILFMLILGFNSFIYYFKSWQDAELTAERLQKENIRSQFEALKHQIEPHFFFNSLSVLTSLVYKDADLSASYIAQLSKMYRYILDGKDQTVVPLEQELEFLNAYIFLMTMRHNDSIRFIIEISDESRKYTYIPKNSLQLLAENVIKHNRFSKEKPLLVRISEEDNYVRVLNNLDRRELIEGSSGIGLENIRKRYELISDKAIEIQETSLTFCVKLPKLEKSELKTIDI